MALISIFLPFSFQVSYHGAPEKAYEVFVSALTSRYLEQGLIIPSLEDHNPAGEGNSLRIKCSHTVVFGIEGWG